MMAHRIRRGKNPFEEIRITDLDIDQTQPSQAAP